MTWALHNTNKIRPMICKDCGSKEIFWKAEIWFVAWVEEYGDFETEHYDSYDCEPESCVYCGSKNLEELPWR